MDNSVFTKQYMNKYTKDDELVWKKLYNNQWDYLKETMVASRLFYDGMRELQLSGENIPKFSDINKVLLKTSGWKIRAVKGIVDDELFFQCLREKTFPVTTWLRSKDSLDYIEEPDMFHDLFGHVPFLTNPLYTKFLERIGNHAKQIFESDDKDRQRKISRLYWYTIEFGLVRRNTNIYDIYGAGILSSIHESKTSIHPESEKRPFNTTILNEQFKKDELQSFYAYLNSDLKFINQIKIEDI
jgi:phenylalanine-4-hydroxylase